MLKQIILKDENHVKLGLVFPRRAKQLVNQKKAVWLDESHLEIMLNAEEKEESMDVSSSHIKDSAKDTMINNEIADKPIKSVARDKSIIKEAYREKESVVLSRTPIEIIKISKHRTRELHMAFSAVLWVGAAILYFGLSRLLGYTEFTLNVTELSWTWLIFVIAALIECSAEVYFCKKELAVLNENIDLRQINPAKSIGGDFDLFRYQKQLTHKIKLMSTFIFWVSLAFIYFFCGYAFKLWSIAWVVFVLGLFYKLLENFLKKLKSSNE